MISSFPYTVHLKYVWKVIICFLSLFLLSALGSASLSQRKRGSSEGETRGKIEQSIKGKMREKREENARELIMLAGNEKSRLWRKQEH